MDEPGAQPSDAERELAARRRELEREFDDKQRDLKAQHKRQADKLQADRVDWEASRKAQLKDLADRTERVKRQEDNHAKDLAALRAAQRELEAARGRLKETEGAKVEAKEAAAGEEEARGRLRRAQSLLAGVSFVAVAGSAASCVAALIDERAVALGTAGVTLASALALEWRRRRLAR